MGIEIGADEEEIHLAAEVREDGSHHRHKETTVMKSEQRQENKGGIVRGQKDALDEERGGEGGECSNVTLTQ